MSLYKYASEHNRKLRRPTQKEADEYYAKLNKMPAHGTFIVCSEKLANVLNNLFKQKL